mmetsp:Transcript_16195/g.32819  ORF Transcript_16195/g.32819 Transcript_16195/m.32819 type:complete len:792 (-) Transcript_16195:115-2490(-)
MKISVALFDESKKSEPEYVALEISDDSTMETLLAKAGKALGVEVLQAYESTYLADITDVDEIMPGDEILFKPVKKREADIVLVIPDAMCFSIKDEKNTPLAKGDMSLLLVDDEECAHLMIKVGADFVYSLNAKALESKNARRESAMLPVVIQERRHIVVPTKDDKEFYGIVLPKKTPDGLLDTLVEILEAHALVNVANAGGEVVAVSPSRDSKGGSVEATTVTEIDNPDAKNSMIISGLKTQALEFIVQAQQLTGQVTKSDVVQSAIEAGKTMGSRAKGFAANVSEEVKKTISELHDEIETIQKDNEGISYSEATARVLKAHASKAATGAGATALQISREVSDKVSAVVDESRGEDGTVSPTDLAMNLAKGSASIAKETATRATELTKKGAEIVKESIVDLKLAERLGRAHAMGQEGLSSLSGVVQGMLNSAKEKGGDTSNALVEKLSALNKKINVLKNAQAAGTWATDKMSDSLVGIKKGIAEVQKMVEDKHVNAALQTGLTTLQSALTETAIAIEMAGRDKAKPGEKVGAYIEKGAELTVQGIEASTEMMAMGIRISKSIIKSQLGEGGQRNYRIPSEVKQAILKAQQYSVGAAVISDALVEELVGNAEEIADRIAGSMAKAASNVKISSSSTSTPGPMTGKLQVLGKLKGPIGEAAKQAEGVIGKAAESWAHVVLAMRDASVVLVKELGEATTEIAEHQFGEDIGDAVGAGVEAYTNVTQAITAVSKISDIKAIAKNQAGHALKTAGTVYAESVREQKSPDAIMDAGPSSEPVVKQETKEQASGGNGS